MTQLMVKLATVQAQIKLVKAAIFMNKQKAAISTKMKDFKEYAEGQAEKYAQNMEDANKAIETYRTSVEEAMQQYEDDYLEIMAEQDEWQNMEIEKMGEHQKCHCLSNNEGLQSCTHYLMNQFVDLYSYLQSNIFDKVCISKPCSLSKLVVSHILLH